MSGRAGRSDGYPVLATVKLNIMPLCMCSAMWQWAIHSPRVGDVEQDVDGLPGAHQHGVLPDQVGFGDPLHGPAPGSGRRRAVERVAHWKVGAHLVDQSDLTRSPARNRQSMSAFSAPVARSISFHARWPLFWPRAAAPPARRSR